MTATTPDTKREPAAAATPLLDRAVHTLTARNGVRTFLLACAAIGLALVVSGIIILLTGKDPFLAYAALIKGAAGTTRRLAFALNKSTPYILAGIGVALCFRAKVINIGAEGQIAVGGIAATYIALNMLWLPPALLIVVALAAGAICGAAWSALAATIRLKRSVHEVLCTLLLNFIGVLLVSEALHGDMGEPGAGFPQSPLLARTAWLPKLWPGTDLHIGILIAIVAAIGGHVLLWRTTFGFRLRVMGASPQAATYVGISQPRCILAVMTLAGALAGLAGGIEVLGVHYRLIEGFSTGFGFNAVAVALIASVNPIAVLPAGLFFGFLEAGALAMQREVGVPSSLVFVIQGLTMVFVLCAIGIGSREQKV
jgi:general nucleoside transport system permease protein